MNYHMLWVCFKAKFNDLTMVQLIESSESSNSSYSLRLLEAEAARDHGIQFDYHWYSIDVMARAMMMASKIVRTVLDNMETKQQMAKVKR